METDIHQPVHPVRFVTAASLFDGHDASINIMRRILQAQGVEVIHLGHNRSVDEIVTAALQEDVQGVAVSSYQGGHVEFFTYLVDLLRERGAGEVKVFGGGGGTILPAEIEHLQAHGVSRIFSPHDGQQLGLPAMINLLVRDSDVDLAAGRAPAVDALLGGDQRALARTITMLEAGTLPAADRDEIRAAAERRRAPVLGITGTGGSGKSSLTDELVGRFRLDFEDKVTVAVLANMARGPLVVTSDLVACLKNGLIAGAVMDVTDPEPLAPSSELWDLPNVIFTPHVGGQSAWRIDNMTKCFCENLRRWQAGEPLVNFLTDKRLGFPIRGAGYPLWTDVAEAL